MIDHVTVRVSDLDVSRRFSAHALGLLQHAPQWESDEWGDFSMYRSDTERGVTRRLHVGFQADSRDEVDSWWRAMVVAGASDDGAPGPRPECGPTYYGAFVLDPDGNNIEAVCHYR